MVLGPKLPAGLQKRNFLLPLDVAMGQSLLLGGSTSKRMSFLPFALALRVDHLHLLPQHAHYSTEKYNLKTSEVMFKCRTCLLFRLHYTTAYHAKLILCREQSMAFAAKTVMPDVGLIHIMA